MSQKTKVNKFLAGAVTATMVATAVVPTAALAAKPSEGFSDVGHLAPETLAELDRVVELGLMTGFGNAGLFKPETYMNRGQVAKALAKYEAGKSGMSIAQYYHALKLDGKVQPFADVPKNSSDQELYQASLIVKNAGTFKGVSNKLNPDSNITRGHMASVLVRAFDLKATGKATDFADKGDADTEEIATNMQILKDNGVAKELSDNKFNPNQNVKRIQMASFLLRAYDVENPEAPAGSGITSVKAINDTKIEVTFGKAIDEDLVTEIEKSGERFVVYDGGQTANSSDVIKSETINFSSDRKTAEIILAEDKLKTDIKYTVALMDGDDNEVASVVHKSAPTILKEGAGQPNISVDKEQEKLVLDFKTKMDESAKNVDNYEVFENNKKIGDLYDLVEETEGKWADATTKKAVEFTLKKDVEDGFLAGKTYKIKVSNNVETDDGKKLTSSQQTINFKTPSISEAQPVAKLARVVGDTISVTFDKDLSKDENFNARQVTVKKPSGETVKVNDVKRGNGDKELIIEVEELDSDLTYTIDMPANGVANAYFANASNKEVKGLKAQAQKNIEIKSMKAEFKSQTANKTKADLLLTFDQRPDVDSIKEVVVKEGTDKWELNTDGKVELYYGDTSGKTVIIKDVTELNSDFAIEAGKTYTVEIPYEGVKVDAGADAKKNQEKLKATAKGVSTGDVSIDKVTLKSANEIEIRFDEDIDASNLKAKDIKVKGFEVYSNGNFTEDLINLQGDSQLKISASGDTLTIKTANNNIMFATSFEDLDIEIAKETIKNKSNDSVNEDAIKLTEQGLADKDKIDRAAPVMVGGKVTNTDAVEITYTEAVEFETKADNTKAASQYTVNKASKAAYGVDVSEGKKVKITFNEDETFKSDVDFSKVEVKYAKNVNVFAKDAKGNEAANQTLKGLKADTTIGGATGGKPTGNTSEKPADQLADAQQGQKDAERAAKRAEEATTAEAAQKEAAKAQEAAAKAQKAADAIEKNDNATNKQVNDAKDAAEKAKAAAEKAQKAVEDKQADAEKEKNIAELEKAINEFTAVQNADGKTLEEVKQAAADAFEAVKNADGKTKEEFVAEGNDEGDFEAVQNADGKTLEEVKQAAEADFKAVKNADGKTKEDLEAELKALKGE